MMLLKRFSVHDDYTNCYVAACPNTRQAVIIDPGEWTSAVADYIAANKLTVTCIFLTHAHPDHAAGAAEAQKLYNCKILLGKGESFSGENTEEIEEDDLIEIGDLQGFVIATPGHTPGGVTLFIGDAVFTGDALFSGSVGGTDSREAFAEQAHAIWTKVLTVGDQVSVNPGHGPRSTVGVERLFNPFFDDYRI
jgi:glyoxylase-like metal-dependent hydrolase (beta-lactamase superfamily II)